MGLFKKQKSQKNNLNEDGFTNIIEEVNNCKGKDLDALLEKIESELEKSDSKDRTLLSAKTMVTSRIAVRNSAK